MKKRMWFGGYAAILALAVIACEGILPPAGSEAARGNEPVEYTDDGRALVNLTINTGGEGGKARALTTDMAKAAINYYEVLFYDGSKYYRTAGYRNNFMYLKVPADTYKTDSNGKHAIVLAGTDQDGIKTLLAMGKLTNPADGVITASTTFATFMLTALTAQVSASGSSAFQVTVGGATGSDMSSYATVQYTNIPVPAFYVAKDFANAQATYTIGGFNTDASATGASGSRTFGSLLVAGARQVNYWAVASDSLFSQTPATIGSPAIISPTSGSPIPDNGLITLQFTTPDADCINLISFNLAVKALASTGTGGDLWYIRSGLKNHLPDTGASSSAGILLIMGSVPLMVSTTWP